MKGKDTRREDVGVGLDVGDRYTRVCAVAVRGEVTEILEEKQVQTTREGMDRAVARWPGARVALETGMHGPWIDEHLREGGREVVVVHARKLALVYGAVVKDDRRDARLLGELAVRPPRWLTLVRHRSRATREALLVLKAHGQLVEARTKLINAVRGLVKPFGLRVPACSTGVFAERAREALPEAMRSSLDPLLETIAAMTCRIRGYERETEKVLDTRYPEARRMMQIPGVGAATALCFRLTVEDPGRFRRPREVGPYLGLTPRRDQSGDREAQLGISRAGNVTMRWHLVSSATYILGPHGPDCDLRRWGLRRAERGGPIARRKARVAVARRLAVLMLRLWVGGEKYEPLRLAAQVQEA